MAKVYVALADGFEEAEAILPYDILYRAGAEVVKFSISDSLMVTSSHGVTMQADALLADIDAGDGDMLFLPGGMPGSTNLAHSEALASLISDYVAGGKYLVAVCAAPMVFGQLGLLDGKRATCYPGFEDTLTGARLLKETVVHDGQFITGCGAGAGFVLGAKMVEVLMGKEAADAVLHQMMFGVYA